MSKDYSFTYKPSYDGGVTTASGKRLVVNTKRPMRFRPRRRFIVSVASNNVGVRSCRVSAIKKASPELKEWLKVQKVILRLEGKK